MSPTKDNYRPTKADLDKMVELHREGYNQKQIAKLTGFSQGCISKRLREYRPMHKKLTDKQRNEIIVMSETGLLTHKEIATKMHCGYSTVCRIIAKHRKAKAEKPAPVVTKIHRRGNELHNVDVAPEADQAPAPTPAPAPAPTIAPVEKKSNNLATWALVAVVLVSIGLIVIAAQ